MALQACPPDLAQEISNMTLDNTSLDEFIEIVIRLSLLQKAGYDISAQLATVTSHGESYTYTGGDKVKQAVFKSKIAEMGKEGGFLFSESMETFSLYDRVGALVEDYELLTDKGVKVNKLLVEMDKAEYLVFSEANLEAIDEIVGYLAYKLAQERFAGRNPYNKYDRNACQTYKTCYKRLLDYATKNNTNLSESDFRRYKVRYDDYCTELIRTDNFGLASPSDTYGQQLNQYLDNSYATLLGDRDMLGRWLSDKVTRIVMFGNKEFFKKLILHDNNDLLLSTSNYLDEIFASKDLLGMVVKHNIQSSLPANKKATYYFQFALRFWKDPLLMNAVFHGRDYGDFFIPSHVPGAYNDPSSALSIRASQIKALLQGSDMLSNYSYVSNLNFITDKNGVQEYLSKTLAYLFRDSAFIKATYDMRDSSFFLNVLAGEDLRALGLKSATRDITLIDGSEVVEGWPNSSYTSNTPPFTTTCTFKVGSEDTFTVKLDCPWTNFPSVFWTVLDEVDDRVTFSDSWFLTIHIEVPAGSSDWKVVPKKQVLNRQLAGHGPTMNAIAALPNTVFLDYFLTTNTSVDALVASLDGMNAVTASAPALNTLLSNGLTVDKIFESRAACAALFESQTAVDKIAASNTADSSSLFAKLNASTIGWDEMWRHEKSFQKFRLLKPAFPTNYSWANPLTEFFSGGTLRVKNVMDSSNSFTPSFAQQILVNIQNIAPYNTGAPATAVYEAYNYNTNGKYSLNQNFCGNVRKVFEKLPLIVDPVQKRSAPSTLYLDGFFLGLMPRDINIFDINNASPEAIIKLLYSISMTNYGVGKGPYGYSADGQWYWKSREVLADRAYKHLAISKVDHRFVYGQENEQSLQQCRALFTTEALKTLIDISRPLWSSSNQDMSAISRVFQFLPNSFVPEILLNNQEFISYGVSTMGTKFHNAFGNIFKNSLVTKEHLTKYYDYYVNAYGPIPDGNTTILPTMLYRNNNGGSTLVYKGPISIRDAEGYGETNTGPRGALLVRYSVRTGGYSYPSNYPVVKAGTTNYVTYYGSSSEYFYPSNVYVAPNKTLTFDYPLEEKDNPEEKQLWFIKL